MGWSAFRKTGLTYHNPNLSIKGYTLITPVDAPGVYLLDMSGRIVMEWHFDDIAVSMPQLLPNGHLILSGLTNEARERASALADDDYEDTDARMFRLGGGYNVIREYDWEGNLIWEYQNGSMHHDYHVCDNGDFLIPCFTVLPQEVAAQVQGGYPSDPPFPIMYGDDIIHINRQGEELDRWHVWKMLDPVTDPIQPLQSQIEWTHMNSIDVMPDGQFVCSLRQTSRVILIDPEKREITWRLGEPTVSLQHHATNLPNGNIQIFDNGCSRPTSLPFSQVLEVDPATSEVVWRYAPSNPEQFYSAHISAAQRLANGNVLVCEGATGRLFEITRKGEIVWEWITPFVGGNDKGRVFTWLYRAYRYPLTHPAFKNRTLDHSNFLDVNRAHGLVE